MRKLLFTILFFSSLTLCAQKGFSADTIPDNVWTSMQGKTYIPNDNIQRSDLRYVRVLHWDYDGKSHLGELICNKEIAEKLVVIFKELYAARYPIQHIELPEKYNADDEKQMRANNTSCFCYRQIAGSKRLSYHARGLAIDINPLYNPQVRHTKDGKTITAPKTAARYADRNKTFKYKVTRDDLAYKLQNTVSNGVATGSTAKTISTLNTVKPAPSCCLRLFALSLLRRDTLCRDHEGIDLL